MNVKENLKKASKDALVATGKAAGSAGRTAAEVAVTSALKGGKGVVHIIAKELRLDREFIVQQMNASAPPHGTQPLVDPPHKTKLDLPGPPADPTVTGPKDSKRKKSW